VRLRTATVILYVSMLNTIQPSTVEQRSLLAEVIDKGYV